MFEVLSDCKASYGDVRCVVIGTGRLIRALLVPMLDSMNQKVVLAQPRGNGFCEYQEARPDGTFEMDVVESDGNISTTLVRNVVACGSIGASVGQEALLKIVPQLTSVDLIGVGVTEAGLKPGSPSLDFLARLLAAFEKADPGRKISVINTDNMSNNGEVIYKEVSSKNASPWLSSNVTFHNSMVDRIVGQRDGPGGENVPNAEALPAKAIVVEDLKGVLNIGEWSKVKGAVIRLNQGELYLDGQLKLRIANALHTALVHVAAMSGLLHVHEAMASPAIEKLLYELYEADIKPGVSGMATRLEISVETALSWADAAFEDWIARLRNPGMKFSNWFVCQNCTQKIALRFLPTVVDNEGPPSRLMAFCIAAIMRFLTPTEAPKDDVAIFNGSVPCDKLLARTDVPNGFAQGDGSALTYQWKADVPAAMADLQGLVGASAPKCKSAVASFLAKVPGQAAGADYGSLEDLVSQQYAALLADGASPLAVLEKTLAEHTADTSPTKKRKL